MSTSDQTRVRFVEQIRRNLVALISVFIAVSSLSYNTWRNEKSEHNRNQRMASFEVLLKIGELQELVLRSYYDRDVVAEDTPRMGWALVITIHDLSQILETPLPDAAMQLRSTWGGNWKGLGTDGDKRDAILAGIEEVRQETLLLLRELD